MKKTQRTTLILSVIYLILLTWIILLKKPNFLLPTWGTSVPSTSFPSGASVVTNGAINPDEIFNNLIVFIPVGLYLSMLKPEWSFVQKVLPILGLSLFYEVVQYLFCHRCLGYHRPDCKHSRRRCGTPAVFPVSKMSEGENREDLKPSRRHCNHFVVGFLPF